MKITQLMVFVALLGLTCRAVALDTATNDTAVAKRLDNPIPAAIEKGTIRVRLKTLDDATVFTQATGQLQIPFINVTNDSGSITTYAVVLQQIIDAPALTFELVNTSLVK